MYKLLFITDTNIGGRAGAEQHLETLVRNLNNKSYQAHVLQLAPSVPNMNGNIGHSTFSHLPTNKVVSLNGFNTIYNLIRLINNNHYDCILSYFETSDIISVIASFFTKNKALISSRRDTGFRHSKKLKWLYRFLNKRFKVIIAASEAINDSLSIAGIDQSKINLIYNGVDLDRFQNINAQKIRNELNLDNETILLGMVANLTPVKNHQIVINCIKRFHENNIKIHLLLAGDGPLRNELEQYVKSNALDNYVHFIGRRKDIPDILSGIDIFILASETEGLSNALLEAMAAARPVVATNVGGNPEVVLNGQTGYLVRENDLYELYQAINKLVQSKSLRVKYGQAGFDRVKNEFSVDAMVNKYINAIHTATAK